MAATKKDLACNLKDMEKLIDEQSIEQASSGWMDNGASAIGEGGDAVRVTRRFRIADMEDGKGVGISLMSNVGGFQRTRMLPVLDAYRYSTLLSVALQENILRRNIHKDEIYVAVAKQLEAIHTLVGQDKKLIVSMSRKCYDRLIASAYAGNLGQGYIRQGKLDLYCHSIGDDVILPVPSSRMMTRYNRFDETGLDPASDTKQINWIIIPQHALVGGSQTGILLKATPMTKMSDKRTSSVEQDDNEFAEAYDFDYVKTFTLGVREGMKKAVFACVSE